LTWKIEFDDRARRELRNLDSSSQQQILRYLRERIATDENPRRLGGPLRGELAGLWKYRVGSFRVICDIQDAAITVLVVRIGHRREVCR
jgi:mRNA interferase RelE/StbE